MSGYSRRSGYRRRSGSSSGGAGRWMELRYAGRCSAGGEQLPKGARAFYDPADRSVTCANLEHARMAGLTKEVWKGAPTDGRFVETLSELRLHAGLKDMDGTPLAQTPHGLRRGYEHTGQRCEDAPCCGCC